MVVLRLFVEIAERSIEVTVGGCGGLDSLRCGLLRLFLSAGVGKVEVQEAAAAMGISLEDAKRLQEENAEEIEERKSQLESGGWLK